MFEVLSNILTNVIKFSNEKPITITVKKILKNTTNFKHQQSLNEVSQNNTMENKDKIYVLLSITDKGKGIDPDILPRLFIQFITKSNQGTGLELY
jgi:signal transduction histidine kinase